MDNFYVTLPSNVKSFSTNTVANYKTKLASRLILTDDWEVGLVEISYTLSWYNVPKKEPIYLLTWEDGKIKTAREKAYLPSGRYDNINQIIDLINENLKLIKSFTFKTISKTDSNLKIEYYPFIKVSENNRLVRTSQGVQQNNKCIFIQFSENLCNILGINLKHMKSKYVDKLMKYGEIENEYKKNQLSTADIIYTEPDDDTLTYIGDKPYEISAGYHSLFVYSDIVSPSFVGDSYTQLLRLVEIPSNSKFGEQVKISYPNTYYVPVLVKEFDTIEIDIKDDTGEIIPFEFGRSIVILHFRKVYKRNDNFFL